MEPTIAGISPKVFAELHDALVKKGRVALAEKLAVARLARCTLAEEDDIGYIYFVRRPPSLHFENLATPVAETVDFFEELGINLDFDHDGDLFGLEFLGRPDLVACLNAANQL